MALSREDNNFDQDHPSGGGTGSGFSLRCLTCKRVFRDKSAAVVIKAAQEHTKETGHSLSYKGGPAQNLEG